MRCFFGSIVDLSLYLIVIKSILNNQFEYIYLNIHIVKNIKMIFLKSDPKETEVWINGKLLSNSTPFKYQEIFPGRYDVKLVKYGYVDWRYSFDVESGMVSSNDYIKQFLSDPEKMEVSEFEKENLQKLSANWQPKGLEIKNDNEIWFNDVLVTRFSGKVKNVVWHPDLKHIFFQIDNEIRIMEPDGANNTKLADLKSSETSTFVPLDNGKQLLYSDGEDIKKIRIQ